MTFKPRKLVYRQANNQLQTIADLFIASLLHHRRPDESTIHFLERVFCADTRLIFQCCVNRQLELEGRTLERGQQVFVRHDTTQPNLVEVEFSVTNESRIVEMTRLYWLEVRDYLTVVDKNRDGAEKLFGVRA